jgi:hypothetical protein
MNTVMRTVGGVVGGQMGAALLSAYTISGTGVPSALGFQITFAIGAVAALVGAALAVYVTARRSVLRMAGGLDVSRPVRKFSRAPRR